MNPLQKTQDKINNFALGNTEMAQEFAARLGQQLHSLFNTKWVGDAVTWQDIENIALGENDVLEQLCNDHGISSEYCAGNVDFNWHEARYLQSAVINSVCEFYNLK